MKQLFFLLLALVLHTPLSAASAHRETLSSKRQHQKTLFTLPNQATIAPLSNTDRQASQERALSAAPTAPYAPCGILKAQTLFSSLSLLSRSWQRSIATRAPPY